MKTAMDTDTLSSKYGLTDTGKLLVMFDAIKKHQLPSVDEKNVDSYVYLLSKKGIMPFYYSFKFTPYPCSEEITEDIDALVYTENLSKFSKIAITPKGSEYVKTIFKDAESDYETFSDKLSKELNNYLGWGKREIFDAVYATITS